MALVGLGNLGRALLKYRGFPSRRFQIVALFDNDPRKIGQIHEGLKVEPIEGFRKAVATRNISLALLCVPADAAQRVADQMVSSGIRGILNFAPVPLVVPPTVNVVAVDLSIQLENLAYKAQKTAGRRELRRVVFTASMQPLKCKHHYPVVKRYHNRFWSCFSRFESWPGSSKHVLMGPLGTLWGRI